MVLLLSKKEDAEELIKNSKNLVVHFFADWVLQCQHMNEVMEELSSQSEYRHIKFAKLPAEDIPDVSLRFDVIAVPTVILFKSGNVVGRVQGANPGELKDKLNSLIGAEVAPRMVNLEDRLKSLINMAPVVLFMKGSAAEPKCGFSRQIVEILMSLNVNFKTFDILEDQEVREGLKKFSSWPTYPQLYINGDLIGGLDIVKEMVQSGELLALLPKDKPLEDRLNSLINTSDVMVFMKGNKEAPKCGFSRQLVDLLNESKVNFSTFDILQDNEVRQGLKDFSNWPTYPQLYIKGQLIGGLDIVKELKNSGELKDLLP